MTLRYDPEIEQALQIPDPLAHEAGNLAEAAEDATNNRKAVERSILRAKSRPIQQKLIEASSGRILLYILFALAYMATTYWEWTVSREIYEVLIPGTYPWVPFLCFVLVAFYASACLGETSTHFAVLSSTVGSTDTHGESRKTRTALDRLYDRRPQRSTVSGWFLHPITGALVAAVILAIVYYMSRTRVALLQAAGEAPETEFQTYLPVALYGIEILLGIPTFFCIMWAYLVVQLRSLGSRYTQEKSREAELRQSAIGKATGYVADLNSYNDWARRRATAERPMVPFRRALRSLLEEEWGHDPTADVGPSTPNGSSLSQNGNGTDESRGPSGPSASNNGTSAGHAKGSDGREEDLLNLLDEQINRQNRGL